MTIWPIYFPSISFVAIFIILVGCGDPPLHSDSKSFNDQQWGWNDSFKTSFVIEDTTAAYDLLLDLKHGDDYNYQNIYMSVATEFPSDTIVTSILPINLAQKNGLWYGKCNGGNCNLRVYLQEGVKFDQPGRYSIDFNQHTRQQFLKSLNSISFTIKTSHS